MSKVIKVSDSVYDRLEELRGKRETFSDIVDRLLTTKSGFDAMFQLWYGPRAERDQQTK